MPAQFFSVTGPVLLRRFAAVQLDLANQPIKEFEVIQMIPWDTPCIVASKAISFFENVTSNHTDSGRIGIVIHEMLPRCALVCVKHQPSLLT